MLKNIVQKYYSIKIKKNKKNKRVAIVKRYDNSMKSLLEGNDAYN